MNDMIEDVTRIGALVMLLVVIIMLAIVGTRVAQIHGTVDYLAEKARTQPR